MGVPLAMQNVLDTVKGSLTEIPEPLLTIRDLQRTGEHGQVVSRLASHDSTGHDVGENFYSALLAAISFRALGDLENATVQEAVIAATKLGRAELMSQRSPMLIDYAHFLLLTGMVAEALETARYHLECFPEDPFGHGRFGSYSGLLDRLDDAQVHLELAITLAPKRFEWHNNLGGVLLRLGKLREAVDAYSNAIDLEPEAQKPKQSRARALNALGETQRVVEQFKKDFDDNPDSITRRRVLAKAYVLDDEPAQAVKLIAEALVPLPELINQPPSSNAEDRDHSLQFSNNVAYEDQVALRATLLEIFVEKSAHLKALTAVKQILQLDPKQKPTFIAQQIQILIELGNRKLARKLLAEAKAGDQLAGDVRIRRVEAVLLAEDGDYESAEAIQRELVEKYPGDAYLQSQLAQSLLWMGRLDEATEILEAAAQLNPYILAQVINTGNLPESPDAIEKIKRFAKNYLLPDEARAAMAFAASKMLDQGKDYDAAFEELHTANELINKGLHWKDEWADGRLAKTRAVFSDRYLSNLPPIRNPDRQPVFIVGMPRSGTTLLEQILSAHPDVYAAGEQPVVPRLGRLLKKILGEAQPYPFPLDDFTPELREHAARHYLWSISEFNDEAPYIVDKMPHNFMNLGLIYSIFPQAKVININRDPRDIAISNYQQNFGARNGGMGYAFNLGNIAREINRYYTIMDHWSEVLPSKPFKLNYEDLVTSQRAEMDKVLDYVGLDWVDEMAEFYKVERAVRTASVAQVRSGIYDSSAKKWRRYERHLGEFIEALNPDILAQWEDNP